MLIMNLLLKTTKYKTYSQTMRLFCGLMPSYCVPLLSTLTFPWN